MLEVFFALECKKVLLCVTSNIFMQGEDTTQVENLVEKTKDKGKNIRFSSEGHQTLKDYCDKKGYNLGAFCESAALDRMKRELLP